MVELGVCPPEGGLAQGSSAVGVLQKLEERFGKRCRIPCRHQEPLLVVPDLVGDPTHCAGDHRDTRGHRLEDDQRCSLGQGGNHEHIQESDQRPGVGPVPEKAYALANAEASCES